MQIAAYAVTTAGGKAEPFFYERQVGAQEVLIKVSHCAITTGDVQMMNNAWGDTRYPLVPGHEIIGLVERAGPEVTGLSTGDRVGVGYQLAACFSCDHCIAGNEQFCAGQKVIGVDFPGGLAEHIVVDSRFAFPIPASLDSAKATPLLSSGLTVYAAIARADLTRLSKVAVIGVGGLGHLAIQFLHKMGHEVSAFSRNGDKAELISDLGGKFVDSSTLEGNPGLLRQFDFILSTLNVDYDLNLYLRLLTPQGKFCTVAQPPNLMPVNIGLLYDYAQRTIYGNYTGSRRDMMNMLAFAADHQVQSIVEVMPFSSLQEAIGLVQAGRVPMRMVLAR